MISCVVFEQDEEEPKDEAFSPDGGYIPRILFLGTEGVDSPVMSTCFGNSFAESDFTYSS